MGGLSGAGTVIMRNTNNFAFYSNASTTFRDLENGLDGGSFGPGTGGALSLNGTGTFTVTGSDSDYNGATSVNAGAIAIGATVQPNTTGPLGSGTSAVNLGNTSGAANAAFYVTANGVQMGRDVLVRSGNTGTMTVGGLNTSGTAAYTGNVLLGTSNGNPKGVSLSAEDGGTVEFDGNIVVNGKAGSGYSVTKTGLGTVVLAGSNNYMGGTAVDDGTLVLATASAVPDGSSLTVGAALVLTSLPRECPRMRSHRRSAVLAKWLCSRVA